MRRSSRGGIAAAVALMATSAGVALASGAITPHNGSYAGKPSYTVKGKSETATFTLTVAKHKVSALKILAQVLPLDSSTSYGQFCGAANEITTKGYRRTGKITSAGHFSYSFHKSYSGGMTDVFSVVGHFKSPTHAVGYLRDITTMPNLHSKCDTGKVHFSVKHA
jgi:hypothetical protein